VARHALTIALAVEVLFGAGIRSATAAATLQNFDTAGSTYVPIQSGVAPAPTITSGGPSGNFLRLATTTVVNRNAISFDRTQIGSVNRIEANFDFRIIPGNPGPADGFSFALLNTTQYAERFTTNPMALEEGSEEANFKGSLGVGFDVFKNLDDLNNNHVSIHLNTLKLAEFDAAPVNLSSGQWIHAQIILRPGSFSDVTVILTPSGGTPKTVVNQFKITDFHPYEGRVHFGARSGGASAHHDLDNINVQYTTPNPGTLALQDTGRRTAEKGEALFYIRRNGGSTGRVSVDYATANGSATAGSDYTATSGTLTFADGISEAIVSVLISDDATVEPNETFTLTLSNPTNGVVLGTPITATATIVDNDNPARAGSWSAVIPLPTVPIHMHLLPTGKVMFWDRKSHHHDPPGWIGDPFLFDPNTNNVNPLATPGYDIFCSGHSFLSDGTLLVSGGHNLMNGVGENKVGIYNPFTNTWKTSPELPEMNAGRWYPSNVTLANGDVLVEAGTTTGYTPVNPLPQVWQAADNTWRDLTGAQHSSAGWADFYPYLYLAPNGKVFSAGPQQTSRYIDPTGTGSITDVAKSSMSYRDYGTSVLYDDGKVLIAGGNLRDDTSTVIPSASTEVIDLNGASTWRPVAPMTIGRRQHNSTLLPDGTVLVTGGSSAAGFDNAAGAVLHAELWDPGTETWTPLAAATRYRGYHSNALLLPDGRVMVAGGGHPDSAAGAQLNAEIFSPPYLHKGPRPGITSAPAKVTYGQTFVVQTPNAAEISRVNWIRLGSVTHGFNQNQRINRNLSFTPTTAGLNVTAPSDPNLCPPGHYMLFVLNANGVPSIARIIQIVAMPRIIVNDVSVSEGNSGTKNLTFTVTLSATSRETVTVQYATANGTGTTPADYTAASGTLTIPAGQTSRTINVPVVGDTIPESNDTVLLNLSNPTNAHINDGQGIGTIINDDAGPGLSINDVTVTEGNSGTINANFTVTLSAASNQTVTVSAITSNGSARSPGDYTATGVRLTFAPGETQKTFSVPVKGDLLDEPNETFFIVLSSSINATLARGRGIGTIVDNDAAPTIFIDDISVKEYNSGQTTAALRLRLSAPSGQVVRVNYATANGTATGGNDYVTVASTPIAFNTNSLYAYARVLINGDLLNETNETFLVNLSSPFNATIADAQGIGTILNDDSAPALSINDVSIAEGNAGTKQLTFTVTLSKDSGQSITVNYATADGVARSASDYVAKTGTLTFAPGSALTRTISVTINGDTVVEPNEAFYVFLSGQVNATVSKARGVGTITNDDSSG
jgi:hypothetical protein